jgi:hypothetical protein
VEEGGQGLIDLEHGDGYCTAPARRRCVGWFTQ